MTESKYGVQATENFKKLLFELRPSTIDRALEVMDLVGQNPRMGRLYESLYDLKVPPSDYRLIAMPDEHKTLFYTVDEQKELVIFFHIIDMRANPATRFNDLT